MQTKKEEINKPSKYAFMRKITKICKCMESLPPS